MTNPISNERVTWLKQRSLIVAECIRISQTEMHALQSGGAMRDDLYNALRSFTSEAVAIQIELKALEKYEVSA